MVHYSQPGVQLPTTHILDWRGNGTTTMAVTNNGQLGKRFHEHKPIGDDTHC